MIDSIQEERGRDGEIKKRGWIGPYLGETTLRVREPVFFSPHLAMRLRRPPGVLIVGSPGGGKSFTGFTLTCQMVMQGVWAIYIDPKADALPIRELKGLGQVNVLDLAHGNDGILNPFALSASPSEQILDALETIQFLVGGSLSSGESTAVAPILQRVASGPNPSLNKVIEMLQEPGVSQDGLALAYRLDLMSKVPFARLCFNPSTGTARLRPEDGLTIVTLLGLDLPSADMARSDYSISNNLAVTIMYLLTSFTRRLLQGDGTDEYKRHPKAVIIDEAWAVLATRSGAKVISEIARLGRSLNTAIILISQNAADFEKEGVLNSMSTRMSFRMETADEARGVLRIMNLEESDANAEMIMNLKNGECIMYDTSRRISRVQISDWNEEWAIAFNTTPEEVKKKQEMLVS